MSTGRKPHVHNGHGSDHPRGPESLPETDRDLEPGARPATLSPAQEAAGVVGIVLVLFHALRVSTAHFLPPNTSQRLEGDALAAVGSSHTGGDLEGINESD